MAAAAWYIVPSERKWARWFNILHWPYTLWHLSYPVIGASLAGQMSWPLLGWTVLAFFLGMGIGAHCADLLKGDPLKLGIAKEQLIVVLGLSLLGAVGLGLWQIWVGNVPFLVVTFVPVGALLAVGYGQEWPYLHGDWQFAAWWGAFPLLVGYFAQGIDFTHLLLPAVLLAFLTSTVQRVLSTRVRHLRRRVGDYCVVNVQEIEPYPHHWNKRYDKAWLLAPDEKALAWLSAVMVLVAAASLIRHI